jgi:hypothetical protein
MSGFELIAVAAAIVAAGAYLLRRVHRLLGKNAAGGCCGRCPIVRPPAGR